MFTRLSCDREEEISGTIQQGLPAPFRGVQKHFLAQHPPPSVDLSLQPSHWILPPRSSRILYQQVMLSLAALNVVTGGGSNPIHTNLGASPICYNGAYF